MASKRLPPSASINALTEALQVLRRDRAPIADLTTANPTTAGFDYPEDLLSALADRRALTYAPAPLGIEDARAAAAEDYSRRGAHVSPSDVVLSASTSEAYSWLFKLLCNPGEAVLVPRPSYPLFEHLTGLEAIRAVSYDLAYHGRWQIEFDTIERAAADVRALLVVSPNNPTGSYISPAERNRLIEICARRGWALVVDEVFADYPLDVTAPLTDCAINGDVLSFSLAGASKTLGLPQVKIAWTVVGGPMRARRDALASLELIADTFLSVSTPVQVALRDLLHHAAPVRRQIHQRVRANLDRAREILRDYPACELLRVEGGWSAIVRIPATRSEDAFVLDLLRRERVLVHPGYFFDLPHEAFVVISLLPAPPLFADAFRRVVGHAVS